MTTGSATDDETLARETAEFVAEHLADAFVHWHPHDTLRYALSVVPSTGLALEFGVAGGTTLRIIADALAGECEVVGFDVFTGLPDDWRPGYPKGSFASEPPEVPGARIVVGLFEDTLPEFLAESDEPVVFLHVDADLYASARTVLDLVGPRLAPDAIVVFDELFNYPEWRDHEYRALMEFSEGRPVDYLAYTGNHEQVVVRVP